MKTGDLVKYCGRVGVAVRRHCHCEDYFLICFLCMQKQVWRWDHELEVISESR